METRKSTGEQALVRHEVSGATIDARAFGRDIRVIQELRLLHERLDGSTHKDAARDLGLASAKASQRVQRQALARWGAASLEEYRPRQAEYLRAVAVACEEESRNPAVSVYGQQLAASMAASCILMHNRVEPVPLNGTRA